MDQKTLRDLFDYRDDGSLVWLKKTNFRIKIGTTAGGPRTDGYICIGLDGKRHKAHRLVFLWHHGFLPIEIDHVNGNVADNRIENLRAADRSSNSKNRRKTASATSSRYKGVHWCNAQGAWLAGIMIDKRAVRLGSFDNELDAAHRYDAAASDRHGEFAQLNFPETRSN